MYIIDTHAHLYLPEFIEDLDIILERAKRAGIINILMPAIDSGTHEAMIALESKDSMLMAMMGLHPCSVKENYKAELSIIGENLSQRNFRAIGEIGLDFYWDKTFSAEQYVAFRDQIEMAISYNIPIAIHSRQATDECIEVIQKYPHLRGVFHCFSGNYEQACKIIDTGFLLGIGGVISFKNAGLDKIIEKTGIQHIILETDAPYLAPVPFRGKRNEPAYISYIISKLAEITGISVLEIANITTSNAMNLFGF